MNFAHEDDEDFHIVIADDPTGSSGTMIAEIPAPDFGLCLLAYFSRGSIDPTEKEEGPFLEAFASLRPLVASAIANPMPALTLYVDRFFTSPYALSCFVALEEKGLPYTVVPLGMDKKEHHVAEYRDGSLTGRVPALRDGDYWLSESSAIDEYLEDTYPPPQYPRIFPANLKERGRCRQLQAWFRSDLLALREERPTSSVFYSQGVEALTPGGVVAADRLVRVAETLIADERPNLFSSWCIADTDLAMMLQRLNRHRHPLPAKVKVYADAQWTRPSVRKWLEQERPDYVPY